MRISFTERKIKSLKPPDAGQVDYWDKSLPGFSVRVAQSGRRSWIVMYQAGGRKRRMTLGTYPPMGLADARTEAKSVLARAQLGQDPALELRAAKKAETFAQLALLYLEQYAKPNKKSWRLDEKALERDVIPHLGNIRAKEVTRRDVRDLLARIKARGADIQANRTFEILRRLCNWAVAEDYLATSPCVGVSKPSKENRGGRVLRDAEILGVWDALQDEPALTAAVFKLRLITAQRGGEIMSMRWQDLDAESRWWTIPAEFSKNGLAHRVPLSRIALGVLDEVKSHVTDMAWVFPSPIAGRHLEHLVQATKRIRERSGIDFVPHDLRRTAASHMTSMGIARLTVGKILNHVDRSVTATYDRHSYDPEKRQALEAWGQHLEKILGSKSDPATNVVALNEAR